MRDVTRLEKRKIKRKDAKFFDDVTDILREEGYSNHWHDFREKMHVVFDENESLKSKVEEMQKVLQETRTGISNAYEFGYLKETDQNDVHNMLERINEVLKGDPK